MCLRSQISHSPIKQSQLLAFVPNRQQFIAYKRSKYLGLASNICSMAYKDANFLPIPFHTSTFIQSELLSRNPLRNISPKPFLAVLVTSHNEAIPLNPIERIVFFGTVCEIFCSRPCLGRLLYSQPSSLAMCPIGSPSRLVEPSRRKHYHWYHAPSTTRFFSTTG